MLTTIGLVIALVIIAVLLATAFGELVIARTTPTIIGLLLTVWGLGTAAYLIVLEIAR